MDPNVTDPPSGGKWELGTSTSLSLSRSYSSCGKTQKIPLIDRYVRFFFMLS